MTETDKIVAAIFAANICSGKICDQSTYLQTYDDFINLMASREKVKKKPMSISDPAMERLTESSASKP